MNLVVMLHLAWIGRASVGRIRRTAAAEGVGRAVTGYLPVQLGWAAIVVWVRPAVFRFSSRVAAGRSSCSYGC